MIAVTTSRAGHRGMACHSPAHKPRFSEPAVLRKVAFPCPSCQARIKAPEQLIGQRRNCPGCGCSVVVYDPDAVEEKTELIMPCDSDAILISDLETVDELVFEQAAAKSNPSRRLEELEAENARLKRLLAEFAQAVGQPDRVAS
jgi:hypothetical protein